MISFLTKKYLAASKRWPFFFVPLTRIVKRPIILALSAVSRVRGFYLPRDSYLPLYKATMILGSYEPETVRLCKEIIKKGMTVVDGGAHVGYFTRLFSKLVGPAGKVIAYEPHPTNFEVLKKNVPRSRFDNVVIRQAALGNKRDTATLFVSEASAAHSLYLAQDRVPGIQVEVVPLDEDLPALGVHRVDLVKLDVEGNELEVLKGMKEILANSPDARFILEYRRDNTNISAEDVYRVLTTLDLKIFVIKSDALTPILSPIEISAHFKCNLLATKTPPNNIL